MGKLYNIKVPDEGPLDSPIWFIGEAPGQTEEVQGKPFVGEAGLKLLEVLNRHGLQRNQVRLANLCKYRPFNNDFRNCLGTTELNESVRLLHEQIVAFKPHVIVALGSYPLQFIGEYYGIERYRGSILQYPNDRSIKLIPTRHPSAVLRDRKEYPIFDFDIERAIKESNNRDFNYPQYEFIIDPQGLEKEEWTTKLCNWPTFISSDIENVKGTFQIICIGFGTSPTHAVVYPWNVGNIPHISRILASRVEKCFHFGTHDTIVLEENGLQTNNYSLDTMALQHVLNPELPRSLAFLTSVHTRQIYYKTEGRKLLPDEGKGWSAKTDLQKLYAYNGTDCGVTWDIGNQLRQELLIQRPHLIDLFNYEMEMVGVARRISRAGMLIDIERRDLIKKAAIRRWRKRQGMFNFLASFYNQRWITDCNVNSPKIKDLLYTDLKLPVKKKRDGKVTTDEDAIVELLTYVKSEKEKLIRQDAIQRWQEKETILSTIIEIRGLRKLISSYLNPRISADGRLRATYKVSSVETGRWAAEKFVDKTGVNPQTFPREGFEVTEEDINAQDATLTEAEIKDLLTEEKEEEESEAIN